MWEVQVEMAFLLPSPVCDLSITKMIVRYEENEEYKPTKKSIIRNH
jgi:hypothetical protein